MLNKTFFQSNRDIAKLLAAGLLKQKRQISYTEIEALPMVSSRNEVQEIADYLLETMKAEKSIVKIEDYPILRWDTILTIQ